MQSVPTAHTIIADLGGPSRASRLLSAEAGRSLTVQAVCQWRRNGRIPARWLKHIKQSLEGLGKPVSDTELLALVDGGQEAA